jgi:ketosteroid isomerase-like protein
MSQENVEMVRRLYDLWNRRAFAAAVQLYDPDIEYSRTGSEVPDFECEARGVDEMRQAVRDYLDVWADYRYEPERVRDLGDRVLVLERHIGRGKRSGIEIDHEVGALFTLRDGLVVRFAQYWDFTEALEAAGLPD